jgi:hypothetical protein
VNSTDAETDRAAAAELKVEQDQRRTAATTAWDADEKRRGDVCRGRDDGQRVSRCPHT